MEKMERMALIRHVYVHSPFCRRKCPYCDFFSVEQDEPGAPLRERYFAAVAAEARLFHEEHGAGLAWPLETLYLGGGTPSLVEPERFEALIEALSGISAAPAPAHAVPALEFTIEVNPDSATDDRLLALRRIGVNRFSVGVQSFSYEALALLGRIHSARQGVEAVQRARFAGCDNGAQARVSLDLIYAIPGQSVEDWRRQIDQAIALEPDHISAYGLTYYEGTRLIERRQAGDLQPVCEEDEALMFEAAHAALTAAGYEHYEISNYARPGCACRHNQAVWRGEDYLGLGAAAHSRVAGRRWSNPADIEAYCTAIEAGRLPRQFHEEPSGGPLWRMDRLMLGLRTSEGVDLTRWPAAERKAFERDNAATVRRMVEEGLAIEEAGRLRLTLGGWLAHDAVVGALYRGQ